MWPAPMLLKYKKETRGGLWDLLPVIYFIWRKMLVSKLNPILPGPIDLEKY